MLGLGVAAAVVGIVPWVVTGMRLPLQNLWATAALPDSMPFALLPFSQYELTLIAGIALVGAGVAGLVGRATRARSTRVAFFALLGGWLGTMIISTVQTAVVVRQGLRDDREASLYFAVVLGVIALALTLGVLALCLIARAPRAGALIGITLTALAQTFWLSNVIAPSHALYAGPIQMWVLAQLRWVPAILVGVGIAWAGVATVGRIVAALASLLILWVVPALVTGVANAAGTRALARDPAALLDYAVNVFRSALFLPELALPPLVVAITVAVCGLTVRAFAGRRR
jgi:hypothetical protein